MSNRKVVKRFKVVQQSYEDKDYEDEPKPVLVETKLRERRKKEAPFVRFGEDVPEDFALKRNMLMPDDTLEEGLFDDEVEADFDQDWVKQMMEGPAEENDEVEEIEDDKYPKHTSNRPIEKQFAQMMQEFDDDAELDPEDPRLMGPLPATEYAAAMEQFVREHAGGTYDAPDEPYRHKQLAKGMRRLADENRYFDSNRDGHFMTVLPSRDSRLTTEYMTQKELMREVTLRLLREQKESVPIKDSNPNRSTIEGSDDDNDNKDVKEVHLPGARGLDCETVLSTYSNLYNHPNVICAATKKLKASRSIAAIVNKKKSQEEHADDAVGPTQNKNVPTVLTKNHLDLHSGPHAKAPTAVAADSTDEDDEIQGPPIDLSYRPKKEDPEEKKLRRQLVKQLQRERRQDKKAVKETYKAVHLDRSSKSGKVKQEKASMSLSLVHGGQ